MPFFVYKSHEIHYELSGEAGTPVVVFINGLVQRAESWALYSKALVAAGYQALTFDLLGQGMSSKPALQIDFEENQVILNALMDHLKIEDAYISGVSFGGVTVLKFGLEFPQRVRGLIPMSAFTETDEMMVSMGCNLYEGLIKVGYDFLIRQFIPINFTSKYLQDNGFILPLVIKASYTFNDFCAVQNIIESIQTFKPFSDELKKIKAPTLIMNGEYDPLTPRWCHELMRQNIANSRLVFMPNTSHAFPVQNPLLTLKMILDFVDQVESKTWEGDQTTWIANEDLQSETFAFPCTGNYMSTLPSPTPISAKQ